MTNLKYINPENAAPAQGLYSHATYVPSGPLYFLAGQLAVAADGSVVGAGDFAAQFGQVFSNMGDVLQGLGVGFSQVVKFTTFMVHSQHIPQFMALRAALFPTLFASQIFPPNTLLIVDRLVKEEFLFEVEAVVQAPLS